MAAPRIPALLGAALPCLAAAPSMAASFTFTTLANTTAYTSTAATGVGGSDQVVGWAFDGTTGIGKAAAWPPGTATAYDIGGPTNTTYFQAVNASGVAVAEAVYGKKTTRGGYVVNLSAQAVTPLGVAVGAGYVVAINTSGQILAAIGKSQALKAVIVSGSTITALKVPHSTEAYPTAINDSGDVVGSYRPSNDAAVAQDGFLYANKKYTVLSPIGSVYTSPAFVTDSGVVGGTWFDGTNWHAFTWANGVFTAVGFPGAWKTTVIGVGPNGEVIGNFYPTGPSQSHGYTLQGGTYYQIDDPDPSATSTLLTGVSPLGSLIGNFTNASGASAGFIAQCPAGQAPCT
jgi:hypothetical protein